MDWWRLRDMLNDDTCRGHSFLEEGHRRWNACQKSVCGRCELATMRHESTGEDSASDFEYFDHFPEEKHIIRIVDLRMHPKCPPSLYASSRVLTSFELHLGDLTCSVFDLECYSLNNDIWHGTYQNGVEWTNYYPHAPTPIAQEFWEQHRSNNGQRNNPNYGVCVDEIYHCYAEDYREKDENDSDDSSVE